MSEKENEKISTQDLMEIIQFANYIYNSASNPYGFFTPDMSNRNLLDLNNNPLVPTKDKIIQALSNYKDNQEELQGYSEFMETYDMLYKRASHYYSNMLAFDLDISCRNAYTERDYKSKEFKDDLNRVYKFLDKFDYKSEFQKVLDEIIRHEVHYVWFRDSKGTFNDTPIDISSRSNKKTKTSSYTLQTMPQKYCKLTNLWENGLLYDFDMSYFTKSGVSLASYDPIFKEYFKNTFEDNNQYNYNPTSQLNKRDGTFSLWTQTSPLDGAWVFKFNMSNTSTVPLLSSMIYNCLTDKEIEALQNDKDIISAKAILAGEIQVIDNQKGGSTTDAMVYNMTTLLKLMSLVKKGLSNNVNAVAMPTKDPKMYQFTDNNKDMVTNQIKNTAGQLASGGRILYSDDKLSETEAQNAIISDYNIVKKVYPQFEKFLNFYVNKKTKKYKFNFSFSGSNYPFIREMEQKNLKECLDKGIVLASRTYAKLLNMKPQNFDRLLEEGKYSNWTDKLTSQVQSIYTQSKNQPINQSKKGEVGQGRDKLDNYEISDSGATSREYS